MFRFAMAMAVLLLGTLTTTHSYAQSDRETARIQFERGVGLYESHNYAGALESFQEAYRLAPHPSVRVNMANCYEHLNRPIEALHHFERFLAESNNTPRAQRREVQAAIGRMRALVGEVRFAVAPDGATIVIDDAETRRAPVLEPVLMMSGSHTITVRMEGFTTATEQINIEGGDTQRVSIRLQRGDAVAAATPAAGTSDTATAAATTEPASTDTPAETGEPAEETGEPIAEASAEETIDEEPADDGPGFQLRITTPVMIFGGATAALGVGAIITGALSLSFNGQFDDAVARVNSATTDADRAQARADGLGAADSANTTSIITDVLLIGTIAAAGATAFFVISEGMDSGGDEMADAEAVRVIAVPSGNANGGGVSLHGWF